MSGGVGPSCDIGLTKEDKQHEEIQEKLSSKPQKSPLRRGLFSFRQLNALALVIVLSASGMVAVEDFAFVVLSFFYMYFMSKVAFPILSPSHEPPVFGENNRILSLYVFVGAVVGIFLPVAYIFEGIFEGDKEGIKAATPHVFLLASQIFMEGVAFSDRFSVPIRAFVPVVYNATRIYTLMEWVRNELTKVDEEYHGSPRRLYMGRVLAVANFAFWSFNLFGFLLPFYLPKAFKSYYGNPKIKD